MIRLLFNILSTNSPRNIVCIQQPVPSQGLQYTEGNPIYLNTAELTLAIYSSVSTIWGLDEQRPVHISETCLLNA